MTAQPDGNPFHLHGDGIEIFVRLTPKSARDAIEGVEETADGRRHVKARVRAVAEKGKANKALMRLFADRLGVANGCVRLLAGETARLKTLHVEGDAAALEARLAELLAQTP